MFKKPQRHSEWVPVTNVPKTVERGEVMVFNNLCPFFMNFDLEALNSSNTQVLKEWNLIPIPARSLGRLRTSD